jgi:beta-glucosidase
MGFLKLALLAALPLAYSQGVQTDLPPYAAADQAEAPFPDTTYPNATVPYAVAGAQSGQRSPPEYPSPWGEGLGDWSDAYAKAKAFVSQLTLTEKVNLTTGVGWQGEKCVGNTGSIPRLAFKALCLEDSPLGVRFKDFASAFPAGLTVATTWDRSLFYKRGYGMGSEHRDSGVDIQLGPVVGPIGRSPEGGRNWEGFSPDPYLSGIAVGETVKGIQDAGIMACTKHYILNEQEHFRQSSSLPNGDTLPSSSSNIDDRTMHELYLWPFADAVRAGSASIMCSYEQINNSYGCQNSYTLNRLLKNELGFQGFIMSDWGAQHAGVSSALAGLDQTMPGDEAFNSGNAFWGANLTIAVLNGTVPQWRLDDMAIRIMAAYYYVDREGNQVENAPNFDAWTSDTFGFEHFFASEGYTQVNYHVDVQREHYREIREIAAKGTVLLKNNGGLPLTGKEKLTTVFGTDAGENLWGPNGCGDRGCDNGTLAMGWGSGTANFPFLITPLEAIKHEVRKHRGSIEDVLDGWAIDQASALARRVSQPGVGGACIVFGNSDAGEGYITVDYNEGDRNNLTLWQNSNAMINAVSAECNNTIVVMHTVGPVLVDEWYENPNITAIVWAGIPGEESGNAITDILYGKVNPGGKTPFTWGSSRGQYGTDLLYRPNNGNKAPQDNFQEGVFIDYRAFDRLGETPIYEFGFGLSYTTFSYSNLQVQPHHVGHYRPTTGQTPAAPTYGRVSNRTADYVFPPGFHQVPFYIYPFLNSTNLKTASMDPLYGLNYSFPAGGYDSSPQPYLAAGSSVAPGGNQQLYDVMFTISATITNTGDVVGDEVPQLYISLGGPDDPKVQLRGFDRLTIAPGASATFTADVTRRDLSNWDTVSQNW